MAEKDDVEIEESISCDRTPTLMERIHGDWVEIVAALLLALATVASAWSAYQASRWHGVEAKTFTSANADRIRASEYADLADQELGIDIGLFAEYASAYLDGNQTLLHYFENKLFRDEMRVAVDAWKETNPVIDPDAPSTPFEMPEYVNKNKEQAVALETKAQKEFENGKEAINHADDYVLFTVLFAAVLFFAGISTKFKLPHIRIFILSMGGLLFVASAVFVAFQPVH